MTDINELVGPEPVPVPSPKFPTPWGDDGQHVIDARGRPVATVFINEGHYSNANNVAMFIAEAVNEKVAREHGDVAPPWLAPVLDRIRKAVVVHGGESTLSAVERVVAERDNVQDLLGTIGDPAVRLRKLIDENYQRGQQLDEIKKLATLWLSYDEEDRIEAVDIVKLLLTATNDS